MKTTEINVLIIDDIPCIGESILNRLTDVNLKYHNDFIDIKPWYYQYDVRKPLAYSISEIKAEIIQHNIKYLLVDIGFNRIVDQSYKSAYSFLNIDDAIYSDTRRTEDRMTMDKDVLKNFNDDNMLTNLSGIIVYTYQPAFKKPDIIHNEFIQILPKTFKRDDLMVIETNSEIYRPADAKLHILTEVPENPGFKYHGLIKDFRLYGLFIGEILYNQIRYHHFSSRIKSIERMKSSYFRYYIIAYFLFITINISANLISETLFGSNKPVGGLILLLLGVVVPSLIIWLKPEFFLINRDDKL